MASNDAVEGLKNRVAGHPGPVLSVYLNVNPAYPENQGKGYITRLKTDLKTAGTPDELSARTLDFFKDEPPRARTIVLFATPDGLFEVYRLNLDLPEKVRWGEPDVTPLMLALDEYEHYGVMLLDRDNFRFLVTHLGEIEEVAGAENTLNIAGWRELTISPATATPRGGSAKDDFEHRIEANTRRFYHQVSETAMHEVMRQRIRRVILAGPKERVSDLRSALPNELRERVVGEVHIPTDASESEILEKISSARRRAGSKREAGTLAQARERGVRGVKDTLEALQQGRVYHLLVAWGLDDEVCWSDEAGAAVPEGSSLESTYSEESTRMRPVIDVLVDLAASRGARIDFVREESEVYEDLCGEFGGLVGLIRF